MRPDQHDEWKRAIKKELQSLHRMIHGMSLLCQNAGMIFHESGAQSEKRGESESESEYSKTV